MSPPSTALANPKSGKRATAGSRHVTSHQVDSCVVWSNAGPTVLHSAQIATGTVLVAVILGMRACLMI
eukprot:scaffold483544_cov17-Prasinocladus_malaysianus.AAC.1